MAHLSNFDRWRLSRIAEEMDSLSASSQDDGSEPSRSRDSTLGRHGPGGKLPTTLECSPLSLSSSTTLECSPFSRSSPSENIYSKTLIGGLNPNDAGNFVRSERDANSQGKDALRFIKEKYDSLGKVKVKKPSGAYSVQPSEPGTSEGCNNYESARSTIGGVDDSSLHHVNAGSEGHLVIKSVTVVSPSWVAAGQTVTSPLASHGAQAPFNKQTAAQGFVYKSVQHSSAGRHTPEQMANDSRQSDSGSLRATPASVTSQNNVQSDVTRLRASVTSQEIVQVEMFYSSHKSTVCVCPCLAGLYVGTTKSLSASPPPATTSALTHHHLISNAAFKNDWVFVKSGLPVLVLDSGESHRGRRLNVIIAEQGTGFSLWRDTVNPLSEYTVRSSTFHTMCLSTDPHRVVGLSFDDAASAAEFSRNVQRLIKGSAEEADAPLPVHQGNEKKSSRKKSSKAETSGKTKARLSKAAISQPCCFTHVTKLDGRDMAMVLRIDGSWKDRGVTPDAGDGRNSPQVHWLTDDRTMEHSGTRPKK